MLYQGDFRPELVELNFHLDRNNDGQVNAGDDLLRSGVPATRGEAVYTTTTALDVLPGTSSALLVSANIGTNSSARSAAPRTTSLWLLGLGLPALASVVWSRRMRSLGVFLLMIGGMLWVLTGCPSDDAAVESGTFLVTLTDVAATNPNTGTPVPVDGLPVEGATVTVQP